MSRPLTSDTKTPFADLSTDHETARRELDFVARPGSYTTENVDVNAPVGSRGELGHSGGGTVDTSITVLGLGSGNRSQWRVGTGAGH
jgi:hypothetical protein